MQQGHHEWIHGWKRNGWKTADKKPVKNDDLWRRLDGARRAHDVHWHWVKGHAGHELNERADELAREGVAAARAGATGRPDAQALKDDRDRVEGARPARRRARVSRTQRGGGETPPLVRP